MTSDAGPTAPALGAVRRVVVVMAMGIEAAPLRRALAAESIAAPAWAAALPCEFSRAPARAGMPEVLLAVNGRDPVSGVDSIGTTAAAVTTLAALGAAAKPVDLVLSVGTAGGWRRSGAEVGDVYVAWPRFVCHDRRIALPGFDVLAEGNLPAADIRDAARPLGCRFGVVTTGDSLDESPVDRERIVALGGEVKEMEAVAVAWISRLHGVPVSAVKAITDLVDSPVATEEQFLANLDRAAAALQITTLGLLQRLGNPEAL